MDKTFIAKKATLLGQLKCAICLGGVKSARICPRCSRFYCKECIYNWITKKSETCPTCRASVSFKAMVRGSSINEIQESICQLVGYLDTNLCENHKHHLTLFCYACELNICAKCLFSADHVEHKEQVVPLDEAYEHYRQTLNKAMEWVYSRKEAIEEGLNQMAELTSECEQIDKLVDKSAELVTKEASPAALMNIINIVGTITELHSKRQLETEVIRIDRRGDFMQEPTVLVFCMPEFSHNMKTNERYELTAKDPNGFEWKFMINKNGDEEDEDDNENGEEEKGDEDNDEYCGFLTLLEGKPSEYSVSMPNEEEEVLRLELDQSVKFGWFTPDVDNDTCRVTLEIRQTYNDRIQQLQDRIAQLEKECANQKSFRSFLSDYVKSMGPSSG